MDIFCNTYDLPLSDWGRKLLSITQRRCGPLLEDPSISSDCFCFKLGNNSCILNRSRRRKKPPLSLSPDFKKDIIIHLWQPRHPISSCNTKYMSSPLGVPIWVESSGRCNSLRMPTGWHSKAQAGLTAQNLSSGPIHNTCRDTVPGVDQWVSLWKTRKE